MSLTVYLARTHVQRKAKRVPAKRASTGGDRPSPVDEYLSKLSAAQRGALEKLRRVIRGAAPGAIECISYGLAAFKLDGRPLVALGAASGHCALYLMSGTTVAAHEELLTGYDTSKGTIRFDPARPLPTALVKKLVKARIAENAARGARKK